MVRPIEFASEFHCNSGEGKIRRRAGDALYSFIKSSEISFTRGTDDTISRGNNSMISPLPFPLYFHFSSLFTLNYGGKKYRKIRRQKFLEISIPFNVERYLTKQTNEQRFKANSFLLLLLHSFKFCGFSKIPRCFLCFSMHVLS